MEVTKLAIDSMTRLSNAVENYGLSQPAFKEGVLERISPIEKSQLFDATEKMNAYSAIIEEPSLPNETPLQRDKRHLNRFLRKFRIKLASENFTDSMVSGDILEINTLNHQQIFRNLEFFEFSNYDLETLTFTCWSKLFSRPEIVQRNIFQFLGRVVDEMLTEEDSPIPPHYLYECYAGRSAAFKYTMKKAGCVLDLETGGPMGYITLIHVAESTSLNPDHRLLYN